MNERAIEESPFERFGPAYKGNNYLRIGSIEITSNRVTIAEMLGFVKSICLDQPILAYLLSHEKQLTATLTPIQEAIPQQEIVKQDINVVTG